jgi:hypothetical protein
VKLHNLILDDREIELLIEWGSITKDMTEEWEPNDISLLRKLREALNVGEDNG